MTMYLYNHDVPVGAVTIVIDILGIAEIFMRYCCFNVVIAKDDICNVGRVLIHFNTLAKERGLIVWFRDFLKKLRVRC